MAPQTGLPRRPERTVQPQELVTVHAVELRHLRDLDGARPDGLCLVTLGADRGRRLDAVHRLRVAEDALDLSPLRVHLVPGGLRHLPPAGIAAGMAGGGARPPPPGPAGRSPRPSAHDRSGSPLCGARGWTSGSTPPP